MENKSLVSFDIKSLYTNIPVNKCIKRLEIHRKKTNIKLSLRIHKIIKIYTLCKKHCCFFFSIWRYYMKKNLVYRWICF